MQITVNQRTQQFARSYGQISVPLRTTFISKRKQLIKKIMVVVSDSQDPITCNAY